MVLGEGGRLVAAGAVAGVGLAVLLGRALRPYLYGVGAADPLSLAGDATVFGADAITACLFPALRAARTDLRSALHQD
jgi:hypothetical protein